MCVDASPWEMAEMKSCFSWLANIFEKYWWLWVILIIGVTIVGWLLINNLGIDWLKDSKEITATLKEGIHESITKSEEIEKSAVAEYQSFLSILSLLISVVVAWIAWKQFPKIANQAEAEFITHLDKEWCSKETTQVRAELWAVYKNAENTINQKDPKELTREVKEEIKKKSSAAVQKYIVDIDNEAKRDPEGNDSNQKETNMEHLFRLLNFMELLGTINVLRKNELIDDNLLRNIFGGRLKTYLEFYQGYFKEHKTKTNAEELLEYITDNETKRTLTISTNKKGT